MKGLIVFLKYMLGYLFLIVMLWVFAGMFIGCSSTPTIEDKNSTFSQCQKVRFEKYCKETDGGKLHIVKEVLRFGLEMYSKQEIKNLCGKHYANWGYSYLSPVEDRIDLYCN